MSVLFFVAAGCASSPYPRQVSESRRGAFEAALTAAAGGLIVAWYDTRDGNGEIYIRHLDVDGERDGPELRLTRSAEESYEASLDAFGDMVAVAWYDKAADGTLRARAGLWAGDGAGKWVVDLPPNTRNPVLRTNGREVVVAWIQKEPDGTEQVWIGAWDLRGRAIRQSRLLGPAHETTWNLNMSLDTDGTAWVVYDAVASTRASEVFLARDGVHEVTLQRLTADDGHESKYPDIALNGDRLALTWFDARDGNTEVYLLAAHRADASEDIDTRARRVTHTAAESIGAYLAWNRDRIGLAWSDAGEGQHEIYFQPFDADGSPLAPASRLTRNRTASLVPAIEPWRDGFALAWSEYVPAEEPHGGTSEIAFALIEGE